MLKFFLYLHIAGLLIFGVGLYWYFNQGEANGTASMVGIASALGLGLLMISPYPVVKAIQWMMGQQNNSTP